MVLKDWPIFYEWITGLLGIDRYRDYLASDTLYTYIKNIVQPIAFLERIICGSNVYVFGAGPSLPDHVRRVSKLLDRLPYRPVIVAADGAARALMENNIVPDIVVSDFDGGSNVLLEAGINGSILVLHAHGDNIDLIHKTMPRLLKITKMIIGTTQVYPAYGLHNFGGFTDGDRAVYLAVWFNAYSITLFGMDFGEIVGRYSKPWMKNDLLADRRKRIKLMIAKRLIEEIACRSGTRFYSLMSTGIRCVEAIDYRFLEEI